VALRFSLDCPPLCAPTVFSGLSALLCPYSCLWIVHLCVTQGWKIQRKPKGHTRNDNQEKTVGAHKGGQSKENRRGTKERTTQRKQPGVCPYGFLWIVLSCVALRFLWVVLSHVPLQFSLDCPPLCSPTVFSGLSVLRGTKGQTIQRKL
jgi:hypothetical protein